MPSKKRELEVIFKKLYPLSPKDVLVDIGSGDGIVLRAAARRGAKAVGFELNPILVYISRFLSRKQVGVEAKVANFWLTPLPQEANIVYLFAVSRDIKRLSKKLQKEANILGRPLKVITYGCVIPGKKIVAQIGAHHLYDFIPLQGGKT